ALDRPREVPPGGGPGRPAAARGRDGAPHGRTGTHPVQGGGGGTARRGGPPQLRDDGGRARMRRIHPTAIVDPAAELGEDVEIGPYCVIEGPARIGARTVLRPHVTILGDTT